MSSLKVILALIFILVGQCRCCKNITTCVSTSSTVNCSKEAKCLYLHWSQMVPYAYLDEGDTVPQGIFLGVAKTLLQRCCESCWQIHETAPVNFTDFYNKEPEKAGLSLPYMMSAADVHYLENYVPVIKDPSSAFVKKKGDWKVLLKKLMSTIHDAWPILITALLFSWISGMIIWFMEMWLNDEQFPRMFLRGSWEGFWWAFVSMTTVGYGDRAPRTFLGRVFAICWIMIGICICSIFTAALTSALTMNTFDAQKTITRTKVGVMINSVEAITAIQNQADVHYYNSSGEVWNAVLSGEVEGILLDYYYALVNEQALTADDLIIANVFKPKDWSLGINLISKSLSECMREEYYKDYANILYDAIVKENISEPSQTVSKDKLSGIFDSDGLMFKTILFSCSGIACLIFITGLCWDFACRGGKKIGAWRSKPKSGKVEGKLDDVEELMSELQTVFMSWKKRKTATKEAFSLQTLESKA